jgi:hypothetical protein
MNPIKQLIETTATKTFSEPRYCDVKRGQYHCTGYNDDDVVCRTCAIEWTKAAMLEVARAVYEAKALEVYKIKRTCFEENCCDSPDEQTYADAVKGRAKELGEK